MKSQAMRALSRFHDEADGRLDKSDAQVIDEQFLTLHMFHVKHLLGTVAK